MRRQFILCVKVAWTVAALIILLIYAGVCESGDQACRPVGDTMLLLMGMLTFPAGLICLFVSVIVCGLLSGEYPNGDFMAWFFMICGGCLQWYIIVPILLEEPRFTLLNLNSPVAATPITVEPAAVKPHSSVEASRPANAAVVPAPRKHQARKRHHRVPAFDKFGRTPLERVINRHPRDASA
jgi:hypothetical protein